MKMICVLLFLPAVLMAQTITMTRDYRQCIPGNPTYPYPVLVGGFVATGCTETYAYFHGQPDSPQQTWRCEGNTPAMLHTIREKQCTCFTEYTVNPSVTATKNGSVCTITGPAFNPEYFCDF